MEFEKRIRYSSPGHAGKEGPHLAEGEGNEGFPPPPEKDLESPSSTRLEALVPSRALTFHLILVLDSTELFLLSKCKSFRIRFCLLKKSPNS